MLVRLGLGEAPAEAMPEWKAPDTNVRSAIACAALPCFPCALPDVTPVLFGGVDAAGCLVQAVVPALVRLHLFQGRYLPAADDSGTLDPCVGAPLCPRLCADVCCDAWYKPTPRTCVDAPLTAHPVLQPPCE